MSQAENASQRANIDAALTASDTSTEDSRDWWDKAEIISKMLGAVALPLLLAYVGSVYNDRQRDIDRERIDAESKANRLTGLLKSLASESIRVRKIATTTAEYLAKNNKLPAELVPALLAIAQDSDKEVAGTAVNTLSTAVKTNSALAPSIEKSLAELPSRVYIHIRGEAQRDDANKLSQLLEQRGYVVPGIERVSVGPDTTEVKYFFADKQAAEAKSIADIVASVGARKVIQQLNKGFEGKVNAKQFEVWLAPPEK